MPRKCSICQHAKRKEIEKKLISGVSFRNITKQYGMSIGAVHRHIKKGHLSQKIVKSKETKDIIRDGDLDEQVKYWQNEIQGIYDKSKSKDKRIALTAIDKAFKFIELQERLIGKLKEKTTVNIFMNPQFIIIKQILMEELKDLPEYRARISERLQDAERVSTSD